ncbi:MAG: AMP-binding protein [Verrucomicrobiaceae bacterium]|nr:AMP-binding protein [Verrucomicrobiaceae bacterium]
MAQSKTVSLKNLTVLGIEHLPAGGGFMILPGQLGCLDLPRLEELLRGRKVVYLVEDGAALHPQVREHLDKENVSALGIVPSATDAGAYSSAVQAAAADGALIVHVPAEAASIVAPATTVPGVKLDFLLKAGVPVVPLHVLHPREVALPVGAPHDAGESVFAFGAALAGDGCTLAAYQESLFALAEQCFSRLPALGGSLALALIRGFKKHGARCRVIDGKDGTGMSFDKIFAAALALSRAVRAGTSKKRVGIILPPGVAALIANVAVVLAGKTPVNLNFTASRAAIESSIRQADIDKFLTADLLVRKMQVFPWPPLKQLVMLERLFPAMKRKIAAWYVLSKVLPAQLLARLLGLAARGGHEEASLIFTSGSSGEPKGVVLSHRNLLANVAQFGSRLALKDHDSLLGCLPLFHSFGCTVTLWYPVIYGVNMVTYPSPLEVRKLAELIEKHAITFMIATPTFLRGYLRGVNREQLGSLRLVVTGAEKLPNTVADAFEARFGKRVFEGYGLTETSPVSNVNLPDPEPLGDGGDGHVWLPGRRMGSVGQLMPGIAIRITDPETGARLPIHQSGIIWFKGANIFEGYFKDPKRTADAFSDDGWFRTGDVGRVDLDGFLYIEGRLSRFSKIGGEMVPHETVEEMLVKAMNLEDETVRRIAVIGVPDPDKGEALVLLTSIPGGPEHQEILDLRYRLLERGVPALWIPKKMMRVAEIPVLASGKLDVRACEKIVRG